MSSSAEHHRTDFHAPYAGVPVERHDQRLSGKLAGRDMRAKRGGVNVNGVSTGRLDDLNARRQQLLADVLGAANAVAEVILVQDLLKTLSHGFQVAPARASNQSRTSAAG